MSKIILFSNIKGGVGKTTLCAHFAEYLSMKGVPVVAVDADIQASLSRHREREVEADPGQTVPWAITRLNTLDSKIVKAAMNEYKEQDGIVLTDCPGNLNDNNLSILYSIADLIVIPMSYDVDTIDATGIFVSVISQKSSARLVFLPNRINTTEGKPHEREMRDETISVLGRLGTVTPRIKQSVVIKRYSTLYPLDKYQYAAVEHAFDRIIEIINQLQKKVINPLLSKNDNGISLAESVTKITGVNAESNGNTAAFRKEKSDWHAVGWKKFTEGLEDYTGVKGQGAAVWLPTEVKKQIEQLRANSERNIPIRALAAAMIVAFMEEHRIPLYNIK